MKKNLLQEFVMRRFPGHPESLSEWERRVVQHLLGRSHISRNVAADYDEKRTLGERFADRLAGFGGSWTFILIFCGTLLGWILLNTVILSRQGRTFDPYPYILLNLVLSMLAAIQAPIILMSQNRQVARDRIDAAHDYEVNLKAELEIMALHEKLDSLRDIQWAELMVELRNQTKLLEAIRDRSTP